MSQNSNLKKENNIYDVIVVGGGPSGMMAAGYSAKRGRRVLLLEKNEHLGDKLKATGGGRCNITNAEENQEILLNRYGSAKDFLYSPFAQFGVKETFAFFEERGLPLVIEAGKRVFPVSQRAEDVFLVLEKFMRENGVIIKSGVGVSEILKENEKIIGVVAGKEKYFSESLILATGGLSHPELGATGDGFSWLKSLGHQVKKPSPDIVPLSVPDLWVKELSGVSLSSMKISFFLDGVKKFSKTGPILFTHFGVSGPLILNSARQVKELLKKGIVTAKIDTFPNLNIGALDKQILGIFDKNKNKLLKNILSDIAPLGLTSALLILISKSELDKKVHSINALERRKIVELLKSLPLRVAGLMGFDRAVVSDGGVALKEIDLRTMRSRLFSNLYVTGDLLDINRPSGGFSLQLCWTTGFVAGNNA